MKANRKVKSLEATSVSAVLHFLFVDQSSFVYRKQILSVKNSDQMVKIFILASQETMNTIKLIETFLLKLYIVGEHLLYSLYLKRRSWT